MKENDVSTFCPVDRHQWRVWLEEHHDIEKSVWLVFYKNKSNIPTITWSEAVDEALCFGWIDSIVKPVDDEKFMRFFSRRKPNSVWSAINKGKIERLASEGLMMQAGFDCIDTAKQNGSWTILDQTEALIIPADLATELRKNPVAENYFLNLSRSDKRNILQWLVLARRPETRQKRIAEIAELSGQNLKPRAIRWTKSKPDS